MAAVLHGNLEDFGLADVLQLIGQQRKTGFLELEHDGENVRIGFDQGAVFSASPVGELEFSALGESLVRSGLFLASDFDRTIAQCRASARPLPDLWLEYEGLDEVVLEEMMARLTQETLFRVMGWSSGAFHFSPTRKADTFLAGDPFSVEKVLMDGLRMLDEWRTFPIEIQAEHHVFRVAKASRNQSDADAGLSEILDWLDGRRSIRQVIDASRSTTFEVARQLSEAYLSGQIEQVESAKPGGSRLLVGSRSPWLRVVQWVSATTLPILALACVVGVLASNSRESDPSGQPSLQTRPHAVAQMKFARLRDAHLKEAAGGRAPVSPGIRSGGFPGARFDSPGALAPESLAAYPQAEQPLDWVQAAPRH